MNKSLEHPTEFNQLVPYWIVRLTNAIAHDKFHDEVNTMLMVTMNEAFERGVAWEKKKA